jgi:hypothetical protein
MKTTASATGRHPARLNQLNLTDQQVQLVIRFVRVARPEVKTRVIRMMRYSILKAERARAPK